MNKEDWDYVKARLKYLWHPVELEVDGYKVSLKLETVGTYRNEISIYINNLMDPKWILNDCEERRRFLRPVTSYLFSKKERSKLPKKHFPKAHEPYTYYQLGWKSFRSLKSHLIKNNQSIKLIRPADE